MALPQSFLDELRARTTLSAVIGRAVKLERAGREFRAPCPFHNEKTPSFYVNDDKGFYHCFGCSAHGDAIRWKTDHEGLDFLDAVRELAVGAGMEMPQASPDARARAARIDGVRPALEAAQALYVRELEHAGAAREYLMGRGIGDAAIAAFGLGWAPSRAGHLREIGIGFGTALDAGLAWEAEDRRGESFRGRIMVPVHDARGRLIGFGGRALHPGESVPKYKNSPDSEIFDKGRTLFNLHRAAPAARAAKRLIAVEGYMDVIALAAVGIAEAVAPMGTALTCGTPEALGGQLERMWRIADRPMLAFDGDDAGRRAAVRICSAALPHVAPGRSLSVALFPAGKDPDDVARSFDPAIAGSREAQGRAAVEAVFAEAVTISRLLFDDAAAEVSPDDPESVAAVWERLDALARSIRDEETRAQYLAIWRARYEREISLSGLSAPQLPALHAQIEAEEGGYSWPEDQSESERRLIMIVKRVLELRAQRCEIGKTINDALAMAKAIGFDRRAINAAVRDLEADSGAREDHEAMWALYRRVLRIRGPMSEAMMPAPADARTRKITSATERRLSKTMVMIEARAIDTGEEARHG